MNNHDLAMLHHLYGLLTTGISTTAFTAFINLGSAVMFHSAVGLDVGFWASVT
jgi:hypothetical protein